MSLLPKLVPFLAKPPSIPPPANLTFLRSFSSGSGGVEWNDAWESAWLPDNLTGKTRAPWEADVHFPNTPTTTSSDMDSDTKAFIDDMSENWEQRRGKPPKAVAKAKEDEEEYRDMGKLENMKRDYRIKKQRIHAGLWVQEIGKMEEANLGNSGFEGDNIDKLLDTCSEIFDTSSDALNNPEMSSSELKNKPDGWETMSKPGDGNIWEMSQREEDILLQEFERRIAFNKYQIASFVKTHIFSRRRPIDGWKYMIEEVGPNSRKGKGSTSRLSSVADEATQPFTEERTAIPSTFTPGPSRAGPSRKKK